MAEREGPRGVNQRRLEVEEPTPTGPTAPPNLPAPSENLAPPPPPLPREPSNADLRARQLRWFEERARFEAAARASGDAAKDSK